jgi:ribose transport system ATP-binding protein
VLKPDSGTVTFNRRPVKTVGKNIKNGFGLVPEDRRREGFVPVLSIERNLTAASYDILANNGIVSRRKEIAHAEKAIRDYDVRPPLRRMAVSNLSGGNQQKVVLGGGCPGNPGCSYSTSRRPRRCRRQGGSV